MSKTKPSAALPKKAAAKDAPAHNSYVDMIKEAIIFLKERNGSSRQAIKKYIKANNKSLDSVTEATFNGNINRALAKGEKNGDFLRPKGPSGPTKLAKKETKDASKPAAAKSTTTTKKAATTTKAAAPKKATTTKAKATTTATKAAAPKKTATKAAAAAKPKANASKPRKPAAAKDAPAVEDKAAVVLGKTKSGRVTKSKAPESARPKKAAAAKKAAPKKAAPKKAAAKTSA